MLGLVLATTHLLACAQPALPASFLSAGLTQALNRLGAALDEQSWSSLSLSSESRDAALFPPRRRWSVTLSGSLDRHAPGEIVFSSDDKVSELARLTQVDANPGPAAHGLKLEITVPRAVPGLNEYQASKVFALELAAPDIGTALQTTTYSGASAAVANGVPQLDIFLGIDSCHSPTRQFSIEELTYSADQVATLVVHFSCGERFHGVLRYENIELSGAILARYNGQVWEDEDADGVQAGDGLNRPDGVLPNVRVHLLRDGLHVSTTHTNSQGRYSFEVPLGTYQVEVEPPAGYVITARDLGGDENRDSDIDPQSGRSDPLLLVERNNPDLTVGLGHPGGRGTLPLASTVLQPLRPGDRMSYVESGNGLAYATDTVLPGASSMHGSVTRRVRDSAGNVLFLSNDARGLRLHRAVMELPARGRRYSYDFMPPLVLLQGTVAVGMSASSGAVQVRRTDPRAGKNSIIQLRYAASTEVSLYAWAGVAANVLPEFAGPHGQVAYVDIDRTLRFTGILKGTPLATATGSEDLYGVDLGLLNSGARGVPHVNRLTALRRGAVEDFDNDRRADVLALDNDSASLDAAVVIAGEENVPDDTLALRAWHPHANGSAPVTLGRVSRSAMLRGDFDGDGHTEMLNYDRASGLVSAIDNFDGSSVPRPLAFAPSNAQLFASGDFNRAGRRELLWRDTSTGALTMWALGDNLLPVRTAVQNATGDSLRMPPAWHLAGVGDFDADGASDLLWREAGGNRNVLWQMNGAKRMAILSLPRMDTGVRIAAVNDFDGDGSSDVLWYDSTKRRLRLWLMDGARLQSDLDLGLTPRGATVFASGDYDGNGNADVLWRDGNNLLTLWPLRNARLHQSMPVGRFASNATVVP